LSGVRGADYSESGGFRLSRQRRERPYTARFHRSHSVHTAGQESANRPDTPCSNGIAEHALFLCKLVEKDENRMRKDDPRLYSRSFRPERYFQANRQWYFVVREGEIGPFRTRAQAEREAEAYARARQQGTKTDDRPIGSSTPPLPAD
jgi:hypothetical protein